MISQAAIRKISKKLDDQFCPRDGAWPRRVKVRSLAQLLKAIKNLPDDPGHFFYANVHDNLVGEYKRLSDYRQPRQIADGMRLFADQPAEEGGESVVGIIAKDLSWCFLITADEDPWSLQAAFSGSAGHCRAIAQGFRTVRQPRAIPSHRVREELASVG